MTISEFEEIFRRNAYAPWDFRFLKSRWGPRNGAPIDTCTLVKGDVNNGDCYNIGTPDIPEMTQFREDDPRYIQHRGWKELLIMLCQDRWISPSYEIERLLGSRYFDMAKKGLGCW